MRDNEEQFGERCGLGWTIGEEILFHKDESEPLKRMETVVAKSNACLLQMKVSELHELKSGKSCGESSEADLIQKFILETCVLGFL